MQTSKFISLALLAAAPALAFTNGSLVPSYICNPIPDGLPKSFGQLLPYTREGATELAFNPTAGQNLATVPQVTSNTSLVMNTAYILASFHNSLNSLTAIQQQVTVKTADGGPIKAGQANPLVLKTAQAGVNIDGVLIYAESAPGVREGNFKDTTGMGYFADFPGCGVNKQGQFAGAIQQMVLSDNDTFVGLTYNAPQCMPSGNLTMAGLSVTDGGFGVWKYTYPVTGSNCSGLNSPAVEILIEELLHVGSDSGSFHSYHSS